MYEEIETCDEIAVNGRVERLESAWEYSKIDFDYLEYYISIFTDSALDSFIIDLKDKSDFYFDCGPALIDNRSKEENPKFFANLKFK